MPASLCGRSPRAFCRRPPSEKRARCHLRLFTCRALDLFLDPDLAAEVHQTFDDLISISYPWGSPEWFQLRKEVMELGGMKGSSTKSQRGWYKTFKKTGIIWLL